MGVWNGISLGIREKHIRIRNIFDCVEGVKYAELTQNCRSVKDVVKFEQVPIRQCKEFMRHVEMIDIKKSLRVGKTVI